MGHRLAAVPSRGQTIQKAIEISLAIKCPGDRGAKTCMICGYYHPKPKHINAASTEAV
jgi:hypothetical protein